MEIKTIINNLTKNGNNYEPENSNLPRVMLVEDETIVAMDVQQRLETLGYEVVALATTGEKALQYAASEALDLILMDVKLRGKLDGIQTAEKIRELLDIPIIYLTAFADENTLQRARTTDAFGYLIKPFEDRELRSTIEIALYKYKTEKKIKKSEERYALAVLATNDGIWDWDIENDRIYYSPRWAEMLGLNPDLLSNSSSEWLSRIHPEDQSQVRKTLDLHLSGTKPVFESEYRILHQDGGYRWMLCRGMALFDKREKPYRMAGSQSDISDRKRIEQELIHQALHDVLTGLPNRALFVDRLKYVLDRYQRVPEKRAAVIFLDLDNFKFVNDSFGHGCGDGLLIEIAQRLNTSLRPGDTISRFGGDEFAILLDQLEGDEIIFRVAKRVLKEISKPYQMYNTEITISASIGILPLTAAYQTSEEVLRDVDTAMYSAKKKGRARFETFTQTLREQTLSRYDREIELRQALENNEFFLHYQPIYTSKDRRLVGFEALLRWMNPKRGLLTPADFINILEETKLIIPVGEWVLRKACFDAQSWNDAFGLPLKISVNLSRLQLLDQDLLNKVQSALLDNGLSPELLELEVTESVAMDNVEIAFHHLTELQKMGVKVAIDDFGSGYSSLDHLKRFPANILKIDRTFIEDIKDDDFAIVSAMISMAHELKLCVTGEGVETENQLALLANMKCDEVQGYYFGKGMLKEDIWKILANENYKT